MPPKKRGRPRTIKSVKNEEETPAPIRNGEEPLTPIRNREETPTPIRNKEETPAPIRNEEEPLTPIRNEEEPPAILKNEEAGTQAEGFIGPAGGYVTIYLGKKTKLLHSKRLCATCGYFSKFDKLPKHFALRSDDSIDVVVPVDVHRNDIEAAVLDDTNDAGMDNYKRSCIANKIIFRAIAGKTIYTRTLVSISDAAILATRYGCVNAVKYGLAAALLRACLGTKLLQERPMDILYIAYNLQDKLLFNEAYQYVIGYELLFRDDSVPKELEELVNNGRKMLKKKIRRCWLHANLACRTEKNGDLSDAVAAALVFDYWMNKAGCTDEYLCTRCIYKELRHVYELNTIEPVLKSDVINAIEEGNHSLVKVLVFEKLVDIQEAITPLFEGDKGVNIFTCLEFEGDYPWEEC